MRHRLWVEISRRRSDGYCYAVVVWAPHGHPLVPVTLCPALSVQLPVCLARVPRFFGGLLRLAAILLVFEVCGKLTSGAVVLAVGYVGSTLLEDFIDAAGPDPHVLKMMSDAHAVKC